MEDLTTKNMLEEQIQNCIKELEHVSKGGKEHTLLSADIQKLTKAYVELVSAENAKINDDRKFKEEIRQKDLDRDYRDILERDKLNAQISLEKEKMEFESKARESDRKSREEIERFKTRAEEMLEKSKLEEAKKSGWRDAGIKAAGIIIPTAAYVLFVGLGMRLEFIDNGSITSYTLKELLKVLHPKITA